MCQWQLELFCIMDFLRKAGITQWGISGILLGLGFLFPALWPAGIVGVAYFLYLTQQKQSLKHIILGGFVSWTTKSALAIIWFWSVYPIDWLTFDFGKAQLGVIGSYWLVTAGWLGIGGTITAITFSRLFRSLGQSVWLYILVPVLWLGGELVSSFIFSIMTYGEGGRLTTAFSFGYVGYLFADHQWLLQGARVFGVYSLGIMFVGVAFFSLRHFSQWRHIHQALPISLLGIFFLTAYIPFPSTKTQTDEVHHVLTIDTTFPKDQHLTSAGTEVMQAELEQAMQTGLSRSPDYILLPEDARYFNQTQTPEITQTAFSFLHQNPEVVIVDTGRVERAEKALLQAFIYNGKEQTVDVSQKRYLVPQGEFMPALYVGFLKLLGFSETVDSLAEDISYSVGPKTSQENFSASAPGVLFCFESVSPWGVKKIMAERGTVPFIAHPISHGWFHDPQIFWRNLDSMLKVQAVWNQQYIVSSGSHVVGQVYTPAGKVENLTPLESGDNWQLREAFIPVLQ